MATKVAEAKVRLSLEEKMTAPLKRIKAQFSSLSKSLRLDKLANSTKTLGQSIKGLGNSVGATINRLTKFTALLGLGGGGIIATMLGLSKSLSERSMELDAFAKRAGVSAETLQELIFAGKRFNITSDAMVDGMKELNLRADEFIKTGQGSGAEAFATLGYSAEELQQKLKNPAALFSEIIEQLGNMDKSTQIRFTDELFGGSAGEQFMSLMGKSKKEIASLRKEARQNGHILGNDVIDEGVKFQNSLDSLLEKLGGIRDVIAAGLLPVIGSLIEEAKLWIDTNRQFINDNIKAGLNWLKNILSDLKNPTSDLRLRIDNIINGFMAFYQKIKPIADFLGGPLMVGLIALGALLAGPLIIALASLGAAFINLGFVIMTTPIGWVIAGITALGAAGYLLYKNWDTICAALKALWDNFWGYLTAIFDRITSAFDKGFIQGILTLLYEFNPLKIISDAINNIIAYFFGIDLKAAGLNFISGFYDGVVEKFTALKTWLVAKIQSLTQYLPGWVQEKLGLKISTEETSKALNSVRETIHQTTEVIDNKKASTNIARLNEKGLVLDSDKTLEIPTLAVPEDGYSQKPNNIDASITIHQLKIVTKGDVADIKRIINGVLADHAMRQQRAITSHLSD